ncbi:MAG: ABC transporter permease [Phycisphaeraceae bacterium]|nr:ABC transporter permease [Phycisphaeraceae bacterium]
MDSTAETARLGSWFMPYAAILQHDWRTLWRSRLVRLWLAATALLSLLLALGSWANLQDAPLIASLLFPFLVFPWFLVVLVLGVTPVSATQAETLADGILSRPVTRTGYVLATWAARVLTVLGVYLVAVVPLCVIILLAKRPVSTDHVTLYGLVTTLGSVGLVLTLVVSLGFLAGTLLQKPLLAAVVLIFVWYPVNLVLSTFALEEFSPISLNQASTTQLRSQWLQDPADGTGTSAAEARTMAAQADKFLSLLSGAAIQTKKPEFFEPGKFDDFSLARVMLSYGLATLAALGLSVLCFCRRDL